MQASARVLFVEDDRDLRDSLAEYLTLAGHRVVGVDSALAYYRALGAGAFDVAVIDLGLPDASGYELAEHTRRHTDLAVVILTARDGLGDRVQGYEAGADLYLVKPVDGRELAAALASLVTRRSQRSERTTTLSWCLDRARWALAAPGGARVDLTSLELRFLELLAAGQGRPVERETLLLALYPRQDEYVSRALDALVKRLRAKVALAAGGPAPIRTAHAVGYCFSEPVIIA